MHELVAHHMHVFRDLRGIMISNGNRTEWSQIRSVIIQVTTAQRESDLFIAN